MWFSLEPATFPTAYTNSLMPQEKGDRNGPNNFNKTLPDRVDQGGRGHWTDNYTGA